MRKTRLALEIIAAGTASLAIFLTRLAVSPGKLDLHTSEYSFSDIESRLATGGRVPLEEVPLDLIEAIPGIPRSVAMAVYLKRGALCDLQTIKGVGAKRAESLGRYLEVEPCVP